MSIWNFNTNRIFTWNWCLYTYIFCGKAEGNLLRRSMASPIVEQEGKGEFTGRIVPIYPLTAGVSQLILSRSIRQGLDACHTVVDILALKEILGHSQLSTTQIYTHIGDKKLEEAVSKNPLANINSGNIRSAKKEEE